MPVELDPIPHESPFSHHNIQESLDALFAGAVPEGSHGAAVAIATKDGVKVALAHRLNDIWQVSLTGSVDYHGHLEGEAKLLASW